MIKYAHTTTGVIKKRMQAPKEPSKTNMTCSTAAAVGFGQDHGQLLASSNSRNYLHSSTLHCFAFGFVYKYCLIKLYNVAFLSLVLKCAFYFLSSQKSFAGCSKREKYDYLKKVGCGRHFWAFRLSPKKHWFHNLEAIHYPGKRPQTVRT